MSRYTEALVGGPYDGRTLGMSKRAQVIHVGMALGEDGGPGQLTGFVKPAPLRQLYRRARWREGMIGEPNVRVRSGYLFAGFTHRACPGCNVLVERVEDQETCPLCGEVMSPNAEV